MSDKTCKTCAFWQDYSDRVIATISKARGDIGRNNIELRRCRYFPPPTVASAASPYTDSEFTCSAHKTAT